MFNRFVFYFFVFGCWLKHLDWPWGYLSYSAWYVLVATWIVLCALAVCAYLIKGKKAVVPLTEYTKMDWFCRNSLAAISFFLAGEAYITIAYLLTSFTFMFITFAYSPKKRKRK